MNVSLTSTLQLTHDEPTHHVLASAPERSEVLRLLPGAVYLPGDPDYDRARGAWALVADQRPAAVAEPASPQEVVGIVRCAAALGLRVAAQGTGHNAAPLAAQNLSDVILVRTTRLTDVSVDAGRQIVRVGAGATWEPAVNAAAAAGFSVLHGSSPDVGIAGYSLGGGIGWYARKLGLATNSLTAIEVVTANGELVRTDETHRAELFWALRGGGGSFGVVTALEFRMFPFDTAFGGMLVWDITRAPEVLREWAAWAPGAPDEVTTSFRILRLPPVPDIPEPFRGRSLVIIDGAVLDTDERAEQILAPLRSLAPEVDTFARVPSAALVRLHMDPEGPTPAVGDSTILGSLPEEAIDAFLAQVGPGAQTTCMMAELRQLGGALGRTLPGAGACSHFDGQFLAFGGGLALTPEMGAATRADAGAMIDAVRPWSNGRNYLNFVEEPTDVRTGYDAGTWRQLTGLRSALDPDGLFVGNHRVPRLYEGAQPTW